MGATLSALFGMPPRTPIAPPALEELSLPTPRIAPPSSLA
jgi:hypothetical protein